MKFIDLYAGLGGFHYALEELGHQCVMASEIQKDLKDLYQKNHNPGLFFKLIGDIHTEIKTKDIPEFDILCAGFPCQPFSQAGKRKGLKDPNNGNHFIKIIEIINVHKPTYVFLENVPNLKGHDSGNTWKVIKNSLKKEGYTVKEEIFSPDEFGIPQQRKRIYITAVRNDKFQGEIIYPEKKEDKNQTNITDFIEEGPSEDMVLKEETIKQLNYWEEFLKKIESKALGDVPRFPVWTMEFGATYPFEKIATINYSLKELNNYKGKFGININAKNKEELKEYLPKYSLTNLETFPSWKINYIKRSRDFYETHKGWIKNWVTKIMDWELSHQKFEWNCGPNTDLTLKDKIIQFRPSGIRVKNKDRFPALVLASTQTPIIYDKQKKGGEGFRYITKREAANLQSFPKKNFSILKNNNSAYKAFGNAVNVKVVKEIVSSVIKNNGKNDI